MDFDKNLSKAGILAAHAVGSNIRIKNCHVSGSVTGVQYAGGMTGYSSSATFEDCSVKGTVQSQGWTTGGFIGDASFDTQISHCLSACSVSGDDWNTGGFVGYTEGRRSVTALPQAMSTAP